MTPSSLEQKLRTPVWLNTAAELPTVLSQHHGAGNYTTHAVVVSALGCAGSDGAGQYIIQQAGVSLSWSCTSRSTRSEGCQCDGITYGRIGRLISNFGSINGSNRTY